MMLEKGGGALPLTSLNHISILCRSVDNSLRFYQNVLGFIPVRRPGSFHFHGAWLFNYGVGIHLIQSENPQDMPAKIQIDPKDNHISFECTSMALVEKRLKEMGISHVKSGVEEGGVYVDQLFFHDPDGFMIEVCNCDSLPVIPLAAAVSGGEPTGVCKRAVVGSALAKQRHQKQEVEVAQRVGTAIAVAGEETHIPCS